MSSCILIRYLIFIKQSVCIYIQMSCHCVRLNIEAEFGNQLSCSSSPFRNISIYNFRNPFEDIISWKLPKFIFDFCQFPKAVFRIEFQIQSLILLISANNIERCFRRCAFFFLKKKRTVSSSKESVCSRYCFKAIVCLLFTRMMYQKQTNIVTVAEFFQYRRTWYIICAEVWHNHLPAQDTEQFLY